MTIGRVKWFSNEKGYGFLEAAECKQDIFVHFSDILMDGYKTLKENALVRFELEQGTKGPNARRVSPLEQADAITAHGELDTTSSEALADGYPAMEDMHYLVQNSERQPRYAKRG